MEKSAKFSTAAVPNGSRSGSGPSQPRRSYFACHRRTGLACAFLARIPPTAGARLDRVLSKPGRASLRSYSTGSYKTSFTVVC